MGRLSNLVGVLQQKYQNVLLWKRYVWNEATWRNELCFSLPLRKKLKYAKRGFSASEYYWFGLEHNDYRDYISEYERRKSREINGDFKVILDDKVLFEEMFSKYTRVPKNYAWITDGQIFYLHGENAEGKDIVSYLFDVKKAVLKWSNRGGGSGTYVIEADKGLLLVNGQEMVNTEVEQLFSRKGEAILCEFISQSKFANSLYPDAVNTMRIVCAKQKGERHSKIIIASQRIGNNYSKPIDNVSAGAFAADINLETGELDVAIAKVGPKEQRMISFERHPDTGKPIKGQMIPRWDKLKREIELLTNQFPYLKFVAWDVVLTEDGFCIIEGNASTGCGLFQLRRGIRNTALGDVYRSYGIID